MTRVCNEFRRQIERSLPCPRIRHQTQSFQKIQLQSKVKGNARRWSSLEAGGSTHLIGKISTQLRWTTPHISKAFPWGLQVAGIRRRIPTHNWNVLHLKH